MTGRLLNALLLVVSAGCLWVASGRAIDQAFPASAGGPVAVSVTVSSAGPHAELTPSAVGSARWPTREAMRWKPPHGFLREAFCIHRHESVDWHRAYVDWAGNPSPYSGGMQFLLSTWQRAGGTGHAWEWRPREQVYRAFVIWRQSGNSWFQWGTAGKCGLR